MPVKKMSRAKQSAELNEEIIERYLDEYLEAKEMADVVTERVNKMKANLKSYLDSNGEADEKGSLWLEVGDHKIKSERRVTSRMDLDKAEAWLKKNKKWDEFKVVVEMVDEDKLLAAGYEGTIPKRTFDGFTVQSESFAFKVLK